MSHRKKGKGKGKGNQGKGNVNGTRKKQNLDQETSGQRVDWIGEERIDDIFFAVTDTRTTITRPVRQLLLTFSPLFGLTGVRLLTLVLV